MCMIRGEWIVVIKFDHILLFFLDPDFRFILVSIYEYTCTNPSIQPSRVSTNVHSSLLSLEPSLLLATETSAAIFT